MQMDSNAKAKEAAPPETIDSILNDIQDHVGSLFKAANVLEQQADRLLGASPSAEGQKGEEKAAAVTVIQKLRDLRRELKLVHSRLYDTHSRLEGQF